MSDIKTIKPIEGDVRTNAFVSALASLITPSLIADTADRYRVEQDFKKLIALVRGKQVGRSYASESGFVGKNKVEIMALYSLVTGEKMGATPWVVICDWLFVVICLVPPNVRLPDKYNFLFGVLERDFRLWLINSMTAKDIWERKLNLKSVLSLSSLINNWARRFLGARYSSYSPLESDKSEIEKLFAALEYEQGSKAANIPFNWRIASA